MQLWTGIGCFPSSQDLSHCSFHCFLIYPHFLSKVTNTSTRNIDSFHHGQFSCVCANLVYRWLKSAASNFLLEEQSIIADTLILGSYALKSHIEPTCTMPWFVSSGAAVIYAKHHFAKNISCSLLNKRLSCLTLYTFNVFSGHCQNCWACFLESMCVHEKVINLISSCSSPMYLKPRQEEQVVVIIPTINRYPDQAPLKMLPRPLLHHHRHSTSKQLTSLWSSTMLSTMSTK